MEESRLSSPIGSDQPYDITRTNVEIDVMKSLKSTKGFAKTPERKDGLTVNQGHPCSVSEKYREFMRTLERSQAKMSESHNPSVLGA